MEGDAGRRRPEGGLAAEVLTLCQKGEDEVRQLGCPSGLKVLSLGRGAAAMMSKGRELDSINPRHINGCCMFSVHESLIDAVERPLGALRHSKFPVNYALAAWLILGPILSV